MTEPLRIVVFGSESTGKTTLAEDLAKALRVPWSAEYVREWVDTAGRDPEAADLDAIARGQLEGEDRAIAAAVRNSAKVVVHDTDLLSTIVYAEHYYGAAAVPQWVRDEAAARRPALYLLCDIDLPWSPDPQRNRGDRRAEMQALFHDALATRDLPFLLITGLDAARLNRARLAINALLGA